VNFLAISDFFPNILASGAAHYTRTPSLMSDPIVQKAALIIFVSAIVHTFMVGKIIKFSHRFKKDSMSYRLMHILGEVEAVFGIWALILVFVMAFLHGKADVFNYLQNSVNYTEPLLVFVIMTMAATLPVIYFANRAISTIASALPVPQRMAFFFSAMVIGPLLGSFITEPAAMTVTAVILKNAYFDKGISTKFKYAALSVLFVNISIGGTLTHFAAPPVLMVSGAWGWDMSYMLGNFGWKSAIAVTINALWLTFAFRKELLQEATDKGAHKIVKIKPFVVVVQLMFLAAVVLFHHDKVIFIAIFIFFLGWCEITDTYQEPLQIKSALLVGFFLAGLVVLGKLQTWWLKPLFNDIESTTLFVGTTLLTGITDNAALTYLGTQVDGLTINLKYALVAGAVAGGGLTVIANAPNPAGYGILKDSFGEDGISPVGLLKNSILPTIVAMLCLWFMGNPTQPKGETKATVLMVDVIAANEFKVNNKKYNFADLKTLLETRAKATGGKLRLALLLPEGHGDAHGKHNTFEAGNLEALIKRLHGVGAHTVNSGQVILDYQPGQSHEGHDHSSHEGHDHEGHDHAK
jgi:hypothetical protein